MLDFEKAYKELEKQSNQFISVYDVFLLIRACHPNLSDNQIATILIDQFKTYRENRRSADSALMLDIPESLTEQEQQALNAEDCDVFLYIMSQRLHEAPTPLCFDELLHILEEIEDNGINEDLF